MNQIEENRLAGKVAVVTGSGRGIGRAIAIGYAAAGAKLVCCARTINEIDETVRLIRQAGGQATACTVDVTRYETLENLYLHAQAIFGGIDIVVANAGVSLDSQTVEASDPAAWRATIEVNVIGTYQTVRAAIPYLKARGAGKIIVIGSGRRKSAMAGKSAYSCSKIATWMLVETLALELIDHGISVNELIPGPVKTAMTASTGARFPATEWFKQPEDVVPMALFLATHPDIGPTAQSFSLMRRS